MLVRLSVWNFALIEHLEVEFGPGFNVLTGETGAGKSMVIDAMTALLGARVSAELVRVGTSQARVEGIFSLDGARLETLGEVLQESGIEIEAGEIILAREISATGRSVARVNGRALPVSTLQQIGHRVIDIHGQNDNLSLLRSPEQLALLDGFAGAVADRAAVAHLVTSYRQAQRELSSLERDSRELARRVDLLRFQIDEINRVAPRTEEEELLEVERGRLANAERLANLASEAFTLLADAGPGERAADDLIGEAASKLDEIARIDSSQAGLAEQAVVLTDSLTDLTRSVRSYVDVIELDPERLLEVDERIEMLRQLKRKYGDTIDDVLRFAADAADELATLESTEEHSAKLRARSAQTLTDLAGQAVRLSNRRKETASKLARIVESELAGLNMGSAKFTVELSQASATDGLQLPDGRTVAFDNSGIDRLEFLISTNPGEPLRPLARVASGGETARIMLALKSALADVDQMPVLIFDEVDQGVGGRSGTVVGEKLARLSRAHQVLCVTHLPQIAAHADLHFRIEKSVDEDRTRTSIRVLSNDERIEELAAMLGGTTNATRGAAREMLGAVINSRAAH
ncbi:MAG TPA: DNA repair protein RecN [Chloroflexota bacterium]|nr:DNA repair protein RecN [Chloroflexota bacterium]